MNSNPVHLVVSYPELISSHMELIQSQRAQYDARYSIIAPHFTLVFPVPDICPGVLIAEIRERLPGFTPFSFTIRCALVNQDAFSDLYHLFLVPDEGFSSYVKLHDALYNGSLFPNRRLDIDYIPHIVVANSKDKMQIKRLADEWNKQDLEIHGRMTTLDVLRFDGNSITTIEKFNL